MAKQKVYVRRCKELCKLRVWCANGAQAKFTRMAGRNSPQKFVISIHRYVLGEPIEATCEAIAL